MEFPHYSKRHPEGFSYKIPGWLKPTFRKYISQLAKGTKPKSRFLKNFNPKGNVRIQNYGINKIGKLAGELANWLKLKGKFTTHSFRRYEATALAESGISITALWHAGRWKIYKTAEGYTEHSNLEKKD